MSVLHHVLLSGGIGSRLWPLSRKHRPKQYLPLFEKQSLFQHCVLRNRELCSHLLIVGNAEQEYLSRKNLEELGINDYELIVEAAPRNTAAAIAFAAFHLPSEDIMLVTPSDHIISEGNEYIRAVNQAVEFARTGALVTFGIYPDKPETGYGYIEYDGNNVLSFREKPNVSTASTFIESGCFLWNSGMFCFQAGNYLEELRIHAFDLYESAFLAWENSEKGRLPLNESMNIPSISVDYAVMERSKNIKVIPSTFKWNDLGSFDALWNYYEQQSGSNITNLVLGSLKQVEFLNMENVLLVETEDAILILPRNHSQDVKKLHESIIKEKPHLL